MRILLLEDEESIRGFVRINLKRNDMEVIEAETGEDALELASTEGPVDIALLDVMLPTISGFEVCAKLREAYPRMGIIMLTAKSQEEDKIYGLELGADDYVQKPFSPGELIARIKSLYRRMGAEAAEPQSQTAEQVAADQDGVIANVGQTSSGSVTGSSDSQYFGPLSGSHTGSLTSGSEDGYAHGSRSTGGTDFHAAKMYPSDQSAAQSPGASSSDSPIRSPYHAGGNHNGPGSVNQQYGQQTFAGGAANMNSQHVIAPLPADLYVEPFRLSIAERKLWKGDQDIVLTPTEWTLVRLLMERVGQSVSRDHILSEVWGRYYVGDLKVVDVNIRRIRQKIEKNPSDPAFIETVWGYGYRWKRAEHR